MKPIAVKLFHTLCGMAVMLALLAGITFIPVLAASNGIYIATATPYYKNPVTGTIEDSGGEGSAVLGQSMTESALYRQALVEVDTSGNTYVTVRLQLMDNIQNPKFQADGSRSGSFTAVSASMMQEDNVNNTADYRMKVPSENAIIRCNMYIVPMGREVIFYITVGGLQSGSGDFITSVSVEAPTQNLPAQSRQPAQTEPVSTEQTTATPAEEPQTTEAATVGSIQEGTDFLAGVEGIEEFDALGSRVSGDVVTYKDNGGTGTVLGWVIGGLAAIAAVGFGIWYFKLYKKKKQ